MLSQSDYLALDACALAAGIRRQEYRCIDVMNCAIERAQLVNPQINAIVSDNFDVARAQAQFIDDNPQLLDRSKLAGLPFLIKDLAAVAGLPQSSGSQLYAGFTANHNANIVQRYLDSGLLVLGKTNTPEFGVTLTTEPVANGITRNPWNLDYSTGGSSGGAAAAVAAGIIPAAHATDGGGSIRIPASCCGLFGLKPSRGLTVIEDNLGDCWSGMSVGHVVSQTVRDSAAFLDLVKLQSPQMFPRPQAPVSFLDECQQLPGKLRIAVQTTHPFGEAVDADCVDAVVNAAQLCASLGHEIEEIKAPLDYAPVVRAMSRIINVHVWQAVAPRLTALNCSLQESALEASTRVMAEAGRTISADEYIAARSTLRASEIEMAQFHEKFAIILSPVLAKAPAPIGWLNMNSADMGQYISRFKAYSGFTALLNGTGQPSMSVPLHRTAPGLPVGVMFSAAWGADNLLLQLAWQLEQAQPWPRYATLAD